MLEKGVDVHANDVSGWPLLVRAAEDGQLAVVELLLERGADPLKGAIGDRHPLHFANENGHLPVVRILLQQPTVDPNKKDFSGQTALFKATSRVHHPAVELLLQQKGIDPDNMSNDGFTPSCRLSFRNTKTLCSFYLTGQTSIPINTTSHITMDGLHGWRQHSTDVFEEGRRQDQ